MQLNSTQLGAIDEKTLRRAFAEKPLHKVKHFTTATAAADCTSAAVVAFSAAIPISIIDYSIMARVSGTTDSSLKEFFKGIRTLFLRPHKFFLPTKENKCCIVFWACTTTYLFTYIGSNLAKSYCEPHGTVNEANLAAGIVSGAVNTLFTMWKDGVILRQLPPKNTTNSLTNSGRIPYITRGLFCTRDFLTCAAAFTLAPMLADWITRYTYYHKRIEGLPKDAKLPEDEGKVRLPMSISNTAQIATPAALQFVTTLLHITAIRYRQTYPNFDLKDLTQSLRATYLSSTLMRICRIIPAFGIGGILNQKIRTNLLDKAE
ncbi:unnamed protein product [Phytomonas sp. Hart1]|nr:unnamed protein product [Phytomonas sp. Hart1]|eukprot:CCW72324.1 unnamed protein product [Phytomonas sp. isolate Hart1]